MFTISDFAICSTLGIIVADFVLWVALLGGLAPTPQDTPILTTLIQTQRDIAENNRYY